MNGFRKNKGIVLELTSLLDVIMIMLFWVMTDVSASADSQKEDAKAQVQAVTQQLEEQKQKSADELEKLREDMQKQIDEAYKKAESINSNAAKNQQALDGYTQGMLISLDMRNENGTDKLYISRNDEDIMTVTPDEDISGRLISLFEGLGAADGEVMLAAVVYDGDAVLYRNMRIVENAVQAVSDLRPPRSEQHELFAVLIKFDLDLIAAFYLKSVHKVLRELQPSRSVEDDKLFMSRFLAVLNQHDISHFIKLLHIRTLSYDLRACSSISDSHHSVDMVGKLKVMGNDHYSDLLIFIKLLEYIKYHIGSLCIHRACRFISQQ